MHAKDYLELCRIIGQDAILLENFWTPIKQRMPDGSVELLNDRSFKGRADFPAWCGPMSRIWKNGSSTSANTWLRPRHGYRGGFLWRLHLPDPL